MFSITATRWVLKLSLTPSHMVIVTAAVLAGTCGFVAIIVAILQWREKVTNSNFIFYFTTDFLLSTSIKFTHHDVFTNPNLSSESSDMWQGGAGNFSAFYPVLCHSLHISFSLPSKPIRLIWVFSL